MNYPFPFLNSRAMLKKYESKSTISINIIANGKPMHIAFSAITGGNSVYYTDNEAIQKGMERHYRYGKLFKGCEVVDETPEEQPALPDNEILQIQVTCPDDAKDFLCDKYGISRTKLRSLSAIEKVAKEKGVEFTGLG